MDNLDPNTANAIMEIINRKDNAFKQGGSFLSANTVSTAAKLIDPTGNLKKVTDIAQRMDTIGNTLGAFGNTKGMFAPVAQASNTLNLLKLMKGYLPSRVKTNKSEQKQGFNQQQFTDDIGSLADAQRAASVGAAETIGSSVGQGIRELGTTISTDIKGGLSTVRDAHRDYFELRDNNITNSLLNVQDKVTGWALQAGKTATDGGKDAIGNTVGAIDNLRNSVEKGNKDLENTINENLRGSPPYLRTLAEQDKPANRKKRILEDMNTESEGNIKQIRKKRFRLIREYRELHFKPLAKEIVKAQEKGIFKKAFGAAAIAADIHWRKSVLTELSTIREGMGLTKKNPWEKELEYITKLPVIKGILERRAKNKELKLEQEGEGTATVKMDDGYVKMNDGSASGSGITIETHAKDYILAGTNIFGGLKSSIEGLSTSISTTIRATLLEKVGGLDKAVDQSLLNQQAAFEDLIGTLPSWEGFMDRFEKEDKAKWTSELSSINNEIEKQTSVFKLTKTLIDQKLSTKVHSMEDILNLTYGQIESLKDKTDNNSKELLAKYNTFIEQDKKYLNDISKEVSLQGKTQKEIKDIEKELKLSQREISRYTKLNHEQMTEAMTLDMRKHNELIAKYDMQLADLHEIANKSKTREEVLEENRRAADTLSILNEIKANTNPDDKREWKVGGKKKGILGFLSGIPGIANIIPLVESLGTMGRLAGAVLAPAAGLTAMAGPFLTFAKLFSVVGLVAIMLKPLHSALKVFQSEEGTFTEKLKKAGWTFIDGIIGSVTGVLATVADAFGLEGMASFFRDIKEKGIKAPIQKFFSEGIGLQIKNALGPVFELIKTGFNAIFTPIKSFLGPGGQGEGIGKAIQDIFGLMKIGFNSFMSVFDSVMYAIEPAIEIFKKHINFLGNIFQMALPTLKSIGSLWMNISKIVLPLLLGIGVVLAKVMAPIIRVLLKTFSLLQSILYPSIERLFWIINQTIQGVIGVVNSFLELFDLSSFDKAIGSAINAVALFFGGLPLLIGQMGAKMLLKFIGHVTGSEAIKEFASNFSIGHLATSLVSSIEKAFGLEGTLKNVVTSFLELPVILLSHFKEIFGFAARAFPAHAMRLILFFTEFPLDLLRRGGQILGRLTESLPWVDDIIRHVGNIFGMITKPLDIISSNINKIPIFGATFSRGIDGALNGFRAGGNLLTQIHELGKLPVIKPGAAISAFNGQKRLNQFNDAIRFTDDAAEVLFRSLGTGRSGLLGRIGEFGLNATKAVKEWSTKGPKALQNFRFIDDWVINVQLFSEHFHKLLGNNRLVQSATGFIQRITSIPDWLTKAGNLVGKKSQAAINWLIKAASGGFGMDRILSLFSPIIDIGKNLGTKIAGLSGIFNIFTPLTNILQPAISAAKKLLPWIKVGAKANPLGFIFTAIDALFQGVTGFIKGFKEDGILGGIQGALEGVMMAIIGDLIDLPIKLLTKAVGFIIGLFPGGDKIKQHLFEWADTFSIRNILKPLFNIKEHVQGFIDGFSTDGLMGGIEGIMKNLFNVPFQVLDNLVNKVIKLFGGEGNVDIAGFMKPISDGMASMYAGIQQIILFPFTWIIEPIRTLIQNLQQGQNIGVAIFESIKSLLFLPINIMRKIGEPLVKLGAWLYENAIPDWLKNNVVVKSLTDGIANIFTRVTEIWDSITGKIDDLIPDWLKKDEEKAARKKEEKRLEKLEKERTKLQKKKNKSDNDLLRLKELELQLNKKTVEQKEKEVNTKKKLQKQLESTEPIGDFTPTGTYNIELDPGTVGTFESVSELAGSLDSYKPKAVDLTNMTTMVKTDPVMIDANATRRTQLNTIINQLEYIHECLSKIETPIVGLEKAKVSQQIKTIAKESKTASEAQAKSAPVLKEIDKKIKAELDNTSDFSMFMTAPASLKPVRERTRDEMLEKTQAAHIATAKARAIGEAKQREALQEAIAQIAPTEEEKKEAKADSILAVKKLDESLKSAPVMNQPSLPNMNEMPWTKKLTSTLEGLKSNKWVQKGMGLLKDTKAGEWAKKGMGMLEGTKAGGWLQKGMGLLSKTKAGEGWLGKGKALFDSYKSGGKTGFLDAGVKMLGGAGGGKGLLGGLLGNTKAGGFAQKGLDLFNKFQGGGGGGILGKAAGLLGKGGAAKAVLGKIPGLGGIMAGAGDIMSGLKSGNYGDVLKGGLKTAVNFIPGIGPIASSVAGPLIDGAFKVFKKFGVGKKLKSFGKKLFGKGKKGTIGKIAGKLIESNPLTAGLGEMANAGKALLKGDFKGVAKGLGKAAWNTLSAPLKGIKNVAQGLWKLSPVGAALGWRKRRKAKKLRVKTHKTLKKLVAQVKANGTEEQKNKLANMIEQVGGEDKFSEGIEKDRSFQKKVMEELGPVENIKKAKAKLKQQLKKHLKIPGAALLASPARGVAAAVGVFKFLKNRKARKSNYFKKQALKKKISNNSKVMDYMNAIRSYGSDEQKANLNLTGTNSFGGDEHKMIAHYGSNKTAFRALYNWIGDPVGGYGPFKHPITGKTTAQLNEIKAKVSSGLKAGADQVTKGTDINTAIANNTNTEMEIRSGRGSRGGGVNAINAPTANVQNNTTYQSVKPTVRDDRRMRTAAITV